MNFIAYVLAGKNDEMKIYGCRRNEMFDFFQLQYFALLPTKISIKPVTVRFNLKYDIISGGKQERKLKLII